MVKTSAPVKTIDIAGYPLRYQESDFINAYDADSCKKCVILEGYNNTVAIVFGTDSLEKAISETVDQDFFSEDLQEYQAKLACFQIDDCNLDDYRNDNGDLEIPYTSDNGKYYDFAALSYQVVRSDLFDHHPTYKIQVDFKYGVFPYVVPRKHAFTMDVSVAVDFYSKLLENIENEYDRDIKQMAWDLAYDIVNDGPSVIRGESVNIDTLEISKVRIKLFEA